MLAETAVTEAVVQRHLQAFLQQQGVAAITSDYAEDARFLTEEQVYRGRPEIARFFETFIAALPPRAIERFTLRRLRVEADIAYLTWCVDDDIPLGTDTFVVDGGKIVSQTFAMHRGASPRPDGG